MYDINIQFKYIEMYIKYSTSEYEIKNMVGLCLQIVKL